MNNETTDGGATVPCISLLDDEPAFDLSKLKMELNTVTIMYGPPDATIRQAEKAMMAYINALCLGMSNAEAHGRAVARTVQPLVGASRLEGTCTTSAK